MKHRNCMSCETNTPMNKMYSISERILCDDCAKAVLVKDKQLTKEDIIKCFDPTICMNCNYDNGTNELPEISGFPVCQNCYKKMYDRPYPVWLKSVLAIVFILVVISLFRNYRFFKGYIEVNTASKAFTNNNLQTALKHITEANNYVPESKEVYAIYNLYHGINFVNQNKYREAQKYLRHYLNTYPDDNNIKSLNFYAQGYVAFVDKKYTLMLHFAEKYLHLNPKDILSLLLVASAYACNYCATNNSVFKDKAYEFLNKITNEKTSKKNSGNYYERIIHRLETREIITAEEFNKRYPDGWKKGGEQ